MVSLWPLVIHLIIAVVKPGGRVHDGSSCRSHAIMNAIHLAVILYTYKPHETVVCYLT